MDTSRIKLVYFSPTGTTKRILKEMARGIGVGEVEEVDATRPEVRGEATSPLKDDLVIFGAPVYSGRLPKLAAEYLEGLEGANVPAVVVTVYGNRAYDDALVELRDIVARRGFRPVAGAAFVGEHSFSAAATPIAVGRPDEDDLSRARSFGVALRARLYAADGVGDLREPVLPGNRPYRERSAVPVGAPETDTDLCRKCGICADLCPVGAIDRENPTVTDGEKCIFCCACVKGCPAGARSLTLESMAASARKLAENCRDRREPELFL